MDEQKIRHTDMGKIVGYVLLFTFACLVMFYGEPNVHEGLITLLEAKEG